MPEVIGTWEFKDGSLARVQKTKRKGKDKIILQTLKNTAWKTYQTLNADKLPIILININKKKGVKIHNLKGYIRNL